MAELPPPVGYRHVGQEIRLRRDGTISRETAPLERLRSRIQERLPSILREAANPQQVWNNIVRENSLADHAPVNYAIRLWNLTERS